MISEPRFKGLSTVPSDYDNADGDLSVCLNLIHEDGSLRPIIPPASLYALDSGKVSLIAIHRLGGGSRVHHIIMDNESGSLSYRDVETGLTTAIVSTVGSPLVDVTVIGNMIVLSRENSMEYILWKADEGCYRSLGSGIPELDFKIALDAEFTYKKQYYIGDTLTFIQAKDAVSDSDSAGDGDKELKSEVIPSGTILYKDGYIIEGFELVKGRGYQFNLEYSGPFMTWYLYYGTPDNRLGIACGGTYGASKYFVSEYDGPVYLGIFYSFQQGETVPDDWRIPYQVAYSFFSGDSSGNVGDSILVPANTIENENAIAGVANSFIMDEATGKNRFVSPFFVRFAVRLFDGTYASISQPVLLVPNSASVPFILLHGHDGEYWADAHAFLASLSVCFQAPDDFSKWESIIDGVDIFVSAPAYLYNQGHKHSDSVYPFRNLSTEGDLPGMFSVSRLRKGSLFLEGEEVKRHSFKDALTRTDSASREDYLSYGVVYAPRKPADVISDLQDMSVFYQVAFIDFNTLADSNGWFNPRLSEGALTNLTTRPRLDDSLVSYVNFCGASLHVYNSRLHVFDSSVALPSPAPAFMFTQSPDAITSDIWTRVHLSTDDGKRTMTCHMQGCKVSGFLLWVYYNNPRASRLEMVATVANEFWYWDIPLSPHGFLNGSYAIAKDLDSPFPFSVTGRNPLAAVHEGNNDSPLDKASVIFVSEVNNPFLFRNSLTVSVPCSQVTGIASAAKALSQGQFGQFPLYAFTDQGVWAVEPDTAGSYSMRQPVTRDVCVNPSGITQLDSAVVFPSDRGLMLLSGSRTQCLTDSITGLDCGLDGLAETYPGLSAVIGTRIPGIIGDGSCGTGAGLLRLMRDCGIIYDYPHQRLIVYSTASPVALVYSLKSGQWGMMTHDLESHVRSYPNAIAVRRGGDVVDFAEEPSEPVSIPDQALLSRPLKLGAPDVLKTVDTVLARGVFRRSGVGLVLYGSRDLREWYPVGSSITPALRNIHGSPYRYFRIAMVCALTSGESISGASVQFTPRFTGRLR